ncbi:MAG: serine protease [Minisyncoccia bacterium]
MSFRKLVLPASAALFTLAAIILVIRVATPETITIVKVAPSEQASTTPVEIETLKPVQTAAVQKALPETAVSLEYARGALSPALVNILCVSNGGPLKSISGTGVIIDPRGIILTAAHIGQYFLLEDYPKQDSISCTIRKGDPAKDAYIVKPIYVSPKWITTNQGTLSEKEPLGTGESDFAFLGVTGSATGETLPPSFPFVSFSTKDPQNNQQVVVGAYAAQFISSSEITSNLHPTFVESRVGKLYTFGGDTLDLISLLGGDAAQEGSSGGGVLDAKGNMVALITTSATTGATSTRELRAITPGHIERSFSANTGTTLEAFIRNNTINALIEAFSSNAEALRALLIANLSRN